MSKTELKVFLAPEKYEELKKEFNLTDEALEKMVSSIQVQRETGKESEDIGDEEEEFKFLSTASKKGEGGTAEVMAYAILADIMDRREDRREERRWRMEQRANPQPKNIPEVETLKSEFSKLQDSITSLTDLVTKREQEANQKTFAQEVVKNTTGAILPSITQLQQRIQAIEDRATKTPQTQESIQGIAKELHTAIDGLGDKLGTKASASKITIDDLAPIFTLMDEFEKRAKKGEAAGELDYKSVGINVMGEIGKELVHTYREIETAKAGIPQGQQKTGKTPTTTMRNIIKRQVQNYIMQRLQAGATQLNIPEAASTLGLTQEQVFQAYQDLETEGWFKSQGGKQHESAETQKIRAEEPELSAEPFHS